MAHDIIDNRTTILADRINELLGSTEKARLAVGYFFISGLAAISKNIHKLKELRLLIGNTSNRETIEQIVEGCRRLDLATDTIESQTYPKRTESRRIVNDTGENLRATLELMDQTDGSQNLILTLVRMIEEERIQVRVYTKGRLNAKAYILDCEQGEHTENGIAIVGSSNLTLAGLMNNTELNVFVRGNENHAALVEWFESLWKESVDFDETLMRELKLSWALVPTSPYDIYMKTIYCLVRDRLEGDDEQELLWDDEITRRLADFQKVAVGQAVQIIRDFGGAFISDVVGMGKSYIGAAIVKHFERAYHARPLIACPAPLVDMWDRYNEVYQLNARVLSMGLLSEGPQADKLLDPQHGLYKDRDFVLIDESHNYRHSDTQRYKLLQSFLANGKRCCLLTATPRNKSAWDVYNQLKLFHQDDKTDLPIDPPNLKEFFRLIEKGERKLQDVLSHVLRRRRRKDILRWYGVDAETHEPVDPAKFHQYFDGSRRAYVSIGGRHQFFPNRKLETIEYSIEQTYQGLYQQLRGYLGRGSKDSVAEATGRELTYARYGLWHYVLSREKKKEPYASLHRSGANLRGLMRILLFKRFESSVYAFHETLSRLIRIHELFSKALEDGFVPAGEEAQSILYESDFGEETDFLDALRSVSQRYQAKDFQLERLWQHIDHDIHLLKRMRKLVAPITPDKDAKLQTLKGRLSEKPLADGKCLIFTQYADTAKYLYKNLNPNNDRDDIEVVYSSNTSKSRVVGRFAPKANPELRFQGGEAEISLLIATDVLTEGLNMQDCDKMINYDLHWNPVRLIQRFGRIDRIGSDHDVIYGFNFLPETGIDQNLGLRQKLGNRIQEIHDTIGEDSAILDQSEQLNEEAMYAIYEKKGGQLDLLEEEQEYVDLNEAEGMLRQIRRDNPTEYERIANLRDGIRAGKAHHSNGFYVFCQAGRYQQLFFVDNNGEIISRDIPRILGAIKCGPAEAGMNLPANHNQVVMKVKRIFTEEVKLRRAEREHTLSLTHGQRYVLRELRVFFAATDDGDIKGQINILEKALRGPITVGLNRELNVLRKNSLTGQDLFRNLVRLYHDHNLRDWVDRRASQLNDQEVPRIICSEAFV